MQNLIARNKEHWLSLTENNQSLCNALQMLLIYATATDGWNQNDALPSPFQEAFTHLKKVYRPRDRDELFREINEKNMPDDWLSPLEPDLLGEYFVLDELLNMDNLSDVIAAFCMQEVYFQFLSRCIEDYATVSSFSTLFKNGMALLFPSKMTETIARIYAILLVNLSNKQNAKGTADIIAILRTLSETRFPQNEDIALVYAKEIVSLSIGQDAQDRADTISALHELSVSRFPQNEHIALEYANGLVIQSIIQDAQDAANTISALHELSVSRFPQNEDVALVYANGLVSLSSKQNIPPTSTTTVAFQALSESRFPQNNYIVLRYAEGLVSLFSRQNAPPHRPQSLHFRHCPNRDFRKMNQLRLNMRNGL